ncbi:low affinity immunoglobulin gamma Fc region receptor III-like [Anabas testudineus]|uniref:low affinity immunoglobulin gamma Fc region receptor III-like n=1 Tax=Anabas testudineus TaxID=64144 RepID=UPI00143D3034|nr:low affinity immunoglobulin gamma Fc region receptor III-like [Anabas testudineus]
MEIASICLLMSATLTVQPDRSQFFSSEALTLNCTVPGEFSGWTVKRNTSTGSFLSCAVDWGRSNGSFCVIRSVYAADTGVYWCESERGERSNVLNITVNTGDVILESPARPAREGDEVTLRCSYKKGYATYSTSQFRATFFKDGVFVGTNTEGKMFFPSVSKFNEGSYKCQHPTKGESSESRLTVTVCSEPKSVPTTPPPPPLVSLKMVFIILLLLLYSSL